MTLRDWLAASGLSARAFARLTLRDDRTVRRWLSGETHVPKAILAFLDSHDPEQYRTEPEPPTEG